MQNSHKLAAVVLVGLLFLTFGLALRQDAILRNAGYKPSFLASVVSLLDNSLFPLPDDNTATENPALTAILNSQNNGGVTILNTPALTKIAEGLFTSNPLQLYAGERYNLRITLGDDMRPEILKNYYINFVKDGVVNTLDAKVDAPVAGGIFTSRILTLAGRASGVLDVSAGEYDGYINVVWDTGTQTIKFKVTVLPARARVQPASLPVVIPQVLPAPAPAPAPTAVILPPAAAAPTLIIEQLAARDSQGSIRSGVYNYNQGALWAYARMHTSGNGLVYNLSLVSRNTSNQYQISSGLIEGSGSKEISYPLPALNTLPTGVYDLTLIAAPRLPNGNAGSYVTRRESITLVNDSNSNPISVIIPPAVTPPTGDGNVTFSGFTNLNTDNRISNRSCSEGGDAVNYSVLSLSQNTAVLQMAPSSSCLAVGDEILIINLQGANGYIGNVGNYELLRVKTISGSTVTFTTDKKKFYGNTADENIGLAPTNQRVMLQRVPNYASATVNSGATVSVNAWDGVRGGVLVFRVSDTLNNNGKITVDSLGYRGGWTPGMQGEGRVGTGLIVAHCGSYSLNYYGSGTVANDIGGGAHHCYGSGAGGSNASAGANGYGNALAGAAISTSNAFKLILGGGGGAAAGAVGANGGGIMLVIANTVNSSGTISGNGMASAGPCGVGTYTYSGGGGAGGSVYLAGPNLNIGSTVSVAGGTGFSCAYTGGTGGVGRFEAVSSL